MIPNGKEMIIDGHKVVFESTTYCCRGCFFENRGSCPDCDEGIWVEEESPWHTGIPTEEGWYLVAVLFGDEIEYEAREAYKSVDFNCNPCMMFSGTLPVLAWQKITPFEASKKRE